MMKKLKALLLVAVMLLGSLSVLAACNKKSAAKVTDGVFEDILNYGVTYTNTLKLKDDGTYYGSYFVDSSGIAAASDAGTWEIINKSFGYVYPGADNSYTTTEDNEDRTASKVIKLTSIVSGTATEYAYDQDTIWRVNCIAAKDRDMKHKPDKSYDASKEVSLVVKKFYFNNREGDNLTIYHDGTFADYTGAAGIEGTWTANGNVYTLISEDGDTYTLTVSIDGLTASYKISNSETRSLVSNLATLDYQFTGLTNVQMVSTAGGQRKDVTYELNCYSNGKFELVYAIAGFGDAGKGTQATGTYTIAEGMVFTLIFAGAEPVVLIPSDGEITYAYEGTNAYFEGGAFTVELIYEVPDDVLTVSYTFTSNNVTGGMGSPTMTLYLYNDDSCKIIITVTVTGDSYDFDTGTYVYTPAQMSFPKFEFTFDLGGNYATSGAMAGSGVKLSFVYSQSGSQLQSGENPITGTFELIMTM